MINTPMQVSTGDMYFYSRSPKRFMVRYIFIMDEPVSRDHLQKAVDIALKRYPYFRVKAVLKDSTYTIEANDAPFVVYEGSAFIAPGDPRINGHLVSFACNGNDLYIDFFHGLTDGRGVIQMVRSVFYYYSIYHYGETPESTGINLTDDPVDPAEFMDPMTVPIPELKPFDLHIPTIAYKLPEEKIPVDAPQVLHPIRVLQKDLMRYVKSMDGSPAALAALFLCRTVDAIHPDHDAPIVCGMAVDFRDDIGCAKTFRNCCRSISLEYQQSMRHMPIETQTMVFRGKIFLQSAAEHLLTAFAKKQKDYAGLESLPTFGEKMEASVQDAIKYPVTVNCSYTGPERLGSIEKHIREKHIYSKFGGGGIVIEVTAVGDSFGIDFFCAVDNEAYIAEFVRQMEAEGIPVERGKPISFDISPRCF